jgi:hypothetical protein
MYIRLIKKPQLPLKYVKHKVVSVYEFYIWGREQAYIAKEFIDVPGGFRKLKLANGNKTLVAERYILTVTKKKLIRVISQSKLNNAYDSQDCKLTEYYLIEHDDIFAFEDPNSEDLFLEPYKVEKTIKVNPDNTPSDGSSKNPVKLLAL